MTNLRHLVLIAIFGALWGALELSLGSALHALDVPFSGLFLAGVGIAVALVGYRFTRRRGSVVQIGLVAALLKAASIGGNVLMPMIGILAEALIVETALALTRGRARGSYVVAGACGTLWPLVHPFVTQGLVAGRGILTVWGWLLEDGMALLGLPAEAALVIVGVLIAFHMAVGAVAGLIAWQTAERVVRRGGIQHAQP